MSQLGKSTPKMRRALTPRVKSVHHVDHLQPEPKEFYSNQKVNQNINAKYHFYYKIVQNK